MYSFGQFVASVHLMRPYDVCSIMSEAYAERFGSSCTFACRPTTGLTPGGWTEAAISCAAHWHGLWWTHGGIDPVAYEEDGTVVRWTSETVRERLSTAMAESFGVTIRFDADGSLTRDFLSFPSSNGFCVLDAVCAAKVYSWCRYYENYSFGNPEIVSERFSSGAEDFPPDVREGVTESSWMWGDPVHWIRYDSAEASAEISSSYISGWRTTDSGTSSYHSQYSSGQTNYCSGSGADVSGGGTESCGAWVAQKMDGLSATYSLCLPTYLDRTFIAPLVAGYTQYQWVDGGRWYSATHEDVDEGPIIAEDWAMACSNGAQADYVGYSEAKFYSPIPGKMCYSMDTTSTGQRLLDGGSSFENFSSTTTELYTLSFNGGIVSLPQITPTPIRALDLDGYYKRIVDAKTSTGEDEVTISSGGHIHISKVMTHGGFTTVDWVSSYGAASGSYSTLTESDAGGRAHAVFNYGGIFQYF